MSNLPPYRASSFSHAADLPPEFWDALMQNEVAANVILSFAKKAVDLPREEVSDQTWIILYDNTSNQVEFVLSCTKGPLGNYPIFIYTPKSTAQLAQEEENGKNIAGPLSLLVLHMLQEAQIPPQRVFSVFSIAKVAEKFADIFEEHTHQKYGIKAIRDLYYDATSSFCTRETLNDTPVPFPISSESEDILIAIRRADSSHLEELRVMCRDFSLTSPPYELDYVHAGLEARTMVDNQQVWVHMIKEGDKEWEIACLVAATRESENVAAVTKVFTAKKWRRRSCAARLLHRVCQEILRKKDCVILYVGNSDALAPARKVYHKVGFQGLDAQQAQEMRNVERWIEIGFEGTTLGYW